MIYGSVCSGIEAATVAWHPLGWRPAFFSEIDPFPRAVLTHHYPEVTLHGDFTQIGGDAGPIDLLVGGTPCQSFSVAGRRLGLDDPRGNLAIEYCRLALRLRPRWIVWENVPGVLSSNGGRDFGAFLGLLGECGYGWAYRVLDAQYVRVDGYPCAVPQRRNRVFVVGCLGDWRRAAAVLFEPEGMRGDTAPRREAGQRLADSLTVGANQYSGFCGEPVEVSMCLNAGGMGRIDYESETLLPVAHTLRSRGFDASEDGTGRGTPIVPIAFSACDFGGDAQVGRTPTLRVGSGHGKMGGGQQMAVAMSMAVRRLTPVECERLQGFPDGYTSVPYRGKPAADGPRYKALGNSMAVNVMRWIGRRIEACEAALRRAAA